MRLLDLGMLGSMVLVGVLGGAPAGRGGHVRDDVQCGEAATQLRTTLYFGLGRPSGLVTEQEWQMFLMDQVTTRFPDGLTVLEAQGQWRQADGDIGHERSKLVVLVHPETEAARAALQEIVAQYRYTFEQESVLWETSSVCVAP
jgi:hypothetical protein